MLNTSNNPYFPTMRRVEQITSSHCGPASCVMLLSFLGVDVSQESIVEMGGASHKVEDYGMLILEMVRGVERLFPQFQFWYKENATLSDLTQIVRDYKYPVAVEWQGVFYEDSDEDDGHYSVITHIDTANNIIMLSDPYKRFAGIDRMFHILEFESRWWDENEVKDPFTGRVEIKRDDHTMFIITSKEVTFPENLGMIRG